MSNRDERIRQSVIIRSDIIRRQMLKHAESLDAEIFSEEEKTAFDNWVKQIKAGMGTNAEPPGTPEFVPPVPGAERIPVWTEAQIRQRIAEVQAKRAAIR